MITAIKDNDSLEGWYLTVLLLIGTLASFYRYDIGASIDHFLLILIFVFLWLVKTKITLTEEFKGVILLTVFITVIGCLITLFHSGQYGFRLLTPASIVTYSLLIAFFISSIKNIDCIKIAVERVILFHTVFIVFQALSWYVFAIQIDFVEWFSGVPSRNTAGLNGAILYRSSGLFNEPGTFAVYMVLLLFLYQYLNGKKILPYVLGSLTIIASTSIQGVMLLIIFALNFLLVFKGLERKVFWTTLIVTILTIILLLYMGYERFIISENGDSSLNVRLLALERILDIPLIGLGFADFPVLGTSNTLFMYLYSYVGLFTITILLSICSLLFTNKAIFVALMVLFSTKITPTAPFFWIFLYTIFYSREKTDNKFMFKNMLKYCYVYKE